MNPLLPVPSALQAGPSLLHFLPTEGLSVDKKNLDFATILQRMRSQSELPTTITPLPKASVEPTIAPVSSTSLQSLLDKLTVSEAKESKDQAEALPTDFVTLPFLPPPPPPIETLPIDVLEDVTVDPPIAPTIEPPQVASDEVESAATVLPHPGKFWIDPSEGDGEIFGLPVPKSIFDDPPTTPPPALMPPTESAPTPSVAPKTSTAIPPAPTATPTPLTNTESPSPAVDIHPTSPPLVDDKPTAQPISSSTSPTNRAVLTPTSPATSTVIPADRPSVPPTTDRTSSPVVARPVPTPAVEPTQTEPAARSPMAEATTSVKSLPTPVAQESVDSAIVPAFTPTVMPLLESTPTEEVQLARLARQDRTQFLDHVRRAITHAVGPTAERLEVEFSPPHVGRLRIEVYRNAGQLHANLKADSEVGRSLLVEHLPAIEQHLSEQGIQIGSLMVDVKEIRDRPVAPNASSEKESFLQGRSDGQPTLGDPGGGERSRPNNPWSGWSIPVRQRPALTLAELTRKTATVDRMV